MRLGSLREKATRGGPRETVVREERVAPCTSSDSPLSTCPALPAFMLLLLLLLLDKFPPLEEESGGRKAVIIATGWADCRIRARICAATSFGSGGCSAPAGEDEDRYFRGV